jgi:hypothetical protein
MQQCLNKLRAWQIKQYVLRNIQQSGWVTTTFSVRGKTKCVDDLNCVQSLSSLFRLYKA